MAPANGHETKYKLQTVITRNFLCIPNVDEEKALRVV